MGDLDRSAYVHLKIIKLKLSTEVKYRDIRVKKCIRANDALNDFEYSDTLWTTPATIRYRKAHLQHRSSPGRYLGPSGSSRARLSRLVWHNFHRRKSSLESGTRSLTVFPIQNKPVLTGILTESA